MAKSTNVGASEANSDSKTSATPGEGSSNEVRVLKERIAVLEKEKEQAEREIEARMKSVDQACIVSETDLKGYITYVNDKHCEVSQYTREELMGSNQNIVRHPDMPKELFKEMWATIGKGQIFRGTVKNRRKDGTPYYVDGIFTPVIGENGKPMKYIGIRFDITEATLESQRMKGIVDAINESFASIEFDVKGNILNANENFLATTGYTRAELLGKHHSIFVDSTYRDTADYRIFWSNLESGKVYNQEIKRVTKSGHSIYLQAVYSPVKDEMGRITKVVKIAIDITAQVAMREEAKQAAEKLKVQEEELRQNMEEMQATQEETNRNAIAMRGIIGAIDKTFAYIEFNTDGTIITANKLFLDTTKYSLEEIKGKHHRIFVPKEIAETSNYEKFWKDLALGFNQAGQFKRVTKTDEEIWLQGNYAPVLDNNNNVVKIIKMASDITEQKRNNLATEQAASEVSRVVVAMANGDLTQLYSVDSQGELKEMGSSLNRAIDNLNNLLGNISQIANLVAASSEELLTKGEQMKGTTMEVASATQQMAEGAQQQAQQTDESSKLIDMALKSSNEMGKKADVISNVAERALKSAQDGLVTIKRVVDNMNEIQESAKTTSGSISILTQRSEEIARTLNVITDIAAQTNLLALNAAIEAARAGDAGRGFAVVAEEIRKLAEDSRKSAVDIEKVIREVQKDINSAGKSIESMETSVKNGNSASREAEVVFTGIQSASSENFEMSKQIIDATENQKEVITNTVKNIEKIVVVSEQTASGTEEIASSTKELSQGMNEVTATSRDLADVAAQLQQSVSKFKLKK